MRRDYKDVPVLGEPKPALNFRTALLCFTFGLGAGLLIAVAFFLRYSPADTILPRETPGAPAPAQNQPPSPPEEPSPPPPAEPKFDFYTILPEMEVQVSGWESAEPLSSQIDLSPEPQGQYILQAGSFRFPQEARQLMLRLRKLGLQPNVQTVELDGQGKWYRVRAGPFSDVGALDRASDQLRQNGIHFILLQEKSPE